MDTKTIRRNNLRLLRDQYDSQKAFAEAVRMDPGHVSQINTGHRQMGDKVARDIETVLHLPFGWMDTPQHKFQQDRAPYDLVHEAELAEAMEKFRGLDHAFRQYILLKMDELAAYIERPPPFLRKQLQAPTSENYQQWEEDMEADRARLGLKNHDRQNAYGIRPALAVLRLYLRLCRGLQGPIRRRLVYAWPAIWPLRPARHPCRTWHRSHRHRPQALPVLRRADPVRRHQMPLLRHRPYQTAQTGSRHYRRHGRAPRPTSKALLILALLTACAHIPPELPAACAAFGQAPRDYKNRIIRNPAARRDFVRDHPCPATGATTGPCPGWVVDHIVALRSGGPDHPCNMQWQATEDARIKDRTE